MIHLLLTQEVDHPVVPEEGVETQHQAQALPLIPEIQDQKTQQSLFPLL